MELFQLEDKNVQQRSAALELIFRCRPFKSPITYFTVLERAMRLFFLSFTSRNCTEPAAVLSDGIGKRPGPGLALGRRRQGCPTLRLLPHAFGQAVPGVPPQRLREQAREDGSRSIKRSASPTPAHDRAAAVWARHFRLARPRWRRRCGSQSFRFLPGWRHALAPAGAGAAGSVCSRGSG